MEKDCKEGQIVRSVLGGPNLLITEIEENVASVHFWSEAKSTFVNCKTELSLLVLIPTKEIESKKNKIRSLVI